MQHSCESVASQKTSRDDMQYSPRGEPNSIAVSSLFAIFVTSVCIACAFVVYILNLCFEYTCVVTVVQVETGDTGFAADGNASASGL